MVEDLELKVRLRVISLVLKNRAPECEVPLLHTVSEILALIFSVSALSGALFEFTLKISAHRTNYRSLLKVTAY